MKRIALIGLILFSLGVAFRPARCLCGCGRFYYSCGCSLSRLKGKCVKPKLIALERW